MGFKRRSTRRYTAIHEAGHAVMQFAHGLPPVPIRICDHDDRGGWAGSSGESHSIFDLMPGILGGPIAEAEARGRWHQAGASGDLLSAIMMLRTRDRIEALLPMFLGGTTQTIQRMWPAVTALADRLDRQGEVGADEQREIVAAAGTSEGPFPSRARRNNGLVFWAYLNCGAIMKGLADGTISPYAWRKDLGL